MANTSIAVFLIWVIGAVMGSYSSNLPREPAVRPCDGDKGLSTEHWIVQKLDHSSATNSRAWQQRYFANFDHFGKDGLIIVIVGGGWAISSGFVCSGFAVDLAKQWNGAVFYLEHRFYGKSHPTTDTSLENLKYLTVDQALGDLENFIQVQKSTMTGVVRSKVILLGSHYGGTLSLMINQRFPDLVTGLWVSGAPLIATESHPKFLEFASRTILRFGGHKCYEKLVNAFSTMKTEIDKGHTWDYEDIFRICPGFDFTNINDKGTFFFEIIKPFLSLSQANDRSKVKAICNHMTDEKYLDPVEALATFLSSNDGPCKDYTFKCLLDETHTENWENSPDLWPYQLCTEFGWFPTSSLRNTLFGDVLPTNYFKNICYGLYNLHKSKLETGLEEMNKKLKLKQETNFSHRIVTFGEFDPWRSLGYGQSSDFYYDTLVIEDTSYCEDMWPVSAEMPDNVRVIQSQVKDLVASWIYNPPALELASGSSTNFIALNLIIIVLRVYEMFNQIA